MALSLLFGKRNSPTPRADAASLRYDAEQQINLVQTDDGLVPAIEHSNFASTQSKTLHRLGDDDPDPDHQRLY